jgi:hypothetical protein
LAVIDVDGDGEEEALFDGVLITRWLFGYRGADLIAGTVDADCTRCTANAIETHLATLVDELDVDDDGETHGLTDGVLALRWLMGLRDASLINGAVDTVECNRCTAEQIEPYLTGLM